MYWHARNIKKQNPDRFFLGENAEKHNLQNFIVIQYYILKKAQKFQPGLG